MSEKSSFFNSVSGDRKYSAEDWAAYFASFISNGVLAAPSNSLQVMANSGMYITVKPGIGFINGYRYENTTDLAKSLAVADGVFDRIDRVVLRWSLPSRTITAEILQGSVASSPSAPTLTRDAETYELALADIRVGAGVTSITQSMITDRRASSSLCGYVTALIDQLDFSSMSAQFDAFLAEYRVDVANDYQEFSDSMDAYEAQAKADFEEWFATVQAVMEGDVAGNLQNQITDLQTLTQSLPGSNIQGGSVTRAKLANDALYSPMAGMSSAAPTRSLYEFAIGTTIRPAGAAVDFTINVTKNDSIPIGAEYAIFRHSAKSLNIVFGDNTKVAIYGEDAFLPSPTITVDTFGMIALKKLVADTNNDYWLVTGPAEVV